MKTAIHIFMTTCRFYASLRSVRRSVVCGLLWFLCGSIALAQSSVPQPTADGFILSWICNAEYQDIDAIPADGTKAILTFGLAGGKDDAERRYTAYNLDIALPYGLEVVTNEEGLPEVGLPEDFSIYAKRISQLSHSIAGSIVNVQNSMLNNKALRVACSSNSNKSLLSAEGDLFSFAVSVTSPYVKPGENKLLLSGQNLTVAEGAQKYVPTDTFYTVNIDEGQVSVKLSVAADYKFTTCLLPFDADVPEGLKAFTCEAVNDGTALLTPVESLCAYVPYIIYAPHGFSGILSGVLSVAAYEERVGSDGVAVSGLLSGAVSPHTITEGYVLRHKDEAMQFCATDGEPYMVPAGKCWLNVNDEASSFAIAEDELAYIDSAVNDDSQVPILNSQFSILNSQCLYDLHGRKVSSPTFHKEVLLLKGKKIVK